jgi:hypothetical protein
MGKRVLELGTADGFLCFAMERRGAQVIACDLSEAQDWDVVPYARSDFEGFRRQRRERIRKLNNAFWLAHRAFGSSAQMVYGTVYDVPEAIGPVDVATFGSLLLHVRDPFLALQRSLRQTRQTVIVTDLIGSLAPPPAVRRLAGILPRPLRRPALKFLPNWRSRKFPDVWWRLSPELIQEFVGVLGFERSQVTYHHQRLGRRSVKLFTVVGHRP